MVYLISREPIKDVELLPRYNLEHSLFIDQRVTVPVIRHGRIEPQAVHFCLEDAEGPVIRYGKLGGSESLNYVVIKGDFHPGDSGAPVIVERKGRLCLLGILHALDDNLNGIVILLGQAEESVIFRQSSNELEFFKESVSQDYSLNDITPLSEYYVYGAANTLPHIHCYSGGFHLKTVTGHRLNIVKKGIVNKNNLIDALSESEGKPNVVDALIFELKKYKITLEELGIKDPRIVDDVKDDFPNMKALWAFIEKNKQNNSLQVKKT